MAVKPQDIVRIGHHDRVAERPSSPMSMQRQLMGGSFRFTSSSAALLDLVDAAYGGLPKHSLAQAAPAFQIELQLTAARAVSHVAEPPPVRIQWGHAFVCGVMDAFNYVVISPEQRSALVVVSEDMLGFPYHLRYELIEFAVYILATRGLGLIPLHGACMGRAGRGVLLLGDSGAGKSTLALQGLLHGLDFVSEDAVLVEPGSLLATGIANYLHVRPDALRFVDDEGVRDWIRTAPTIRRRSGVEKFEVDLRHSRGRPAPVPLALAGVVFVSSQPAEGAGSLLKPVVRPEIAARLRANQPYAASQPGWAHFERQLLETGVHELRRATHPQVAVEALCELLG